MLEPTEKSCYEAVNRWFAPLAAKLGLGIECVNLGVPWIVRGHGVEMARKITNYEEKLYEIVSSRFSLRVRHGVGPWTELGERISLVVTIVPTSGRSDKWEDLTNEIGVYLIAAYYGDTTKSGSIWFRWDFNREAKQVARLVEQYCTPFLQGHSQDWEKIERFRDARCRAARAQARELLSQVPPEVGRSWRLTGESDEEWQQRLLKESKLGKQRLRNEGDEGT